MSASDDDNLSQSSTISNRQRKIECEFCNKEFQARSYFNHCKTKHGFQFSASMINLIKKVKDVNEPFLYEHSYTDEQDEIQFLSVYVCLASNKTFLNEKGWRNHFKKHPADFKKHLAELKKLKASISDAKINYYKLACKSKDKNLTRAYLRRCLYLIPKISHILNLIATRENEKDNWDKDVSNRLNSKTYIPFEKMKETFISTKKQIEEEVNSQTLHFSVAEECWRNLELIIDSVQGHYDCGLFASPESDSNRYGLIIPTDCESPHFGVSDASYPELDF
ncbi:MAG: hypothetical protein ACOYNN_08680 [Terrimicrobiaceae bacterium]